MANPTNGLPADHISPPKGFFICTSCGCLVLSEYTNEHSDFHGLVQRSARHTYDVTRPLGSRST